MNKPHDVPLIEFFVDAFYRKTIDPTSDLYLPKLIQGQTDPTYEPFTAGGWTPATVPQEQKGAEQVCASVTANQSMIPSPGSLPALSFEGVRITGLSNVVPSVPQFAGNTVSVSGSFSSLAPTTAPTPMTVAGSFKLEQACCPTKDFKTCCGASSTYVGSGAFIVQVARSEVAASALIGTTPDKKLLTATVQSLGYTASSDPSNITITAEITSISNPRERKEWDEFAASVLNSPEVRLALVDQIKEVLEQQSTLDSLSTLLTNGLQSLMGANAELGKA
jgi:hypothetical protein